MTPVLPGYIYRESFYTLSWVLSFRLYFGFQLTGDTLRPVGYGIPVTEIAGWSFHHLGYEFVGEGQLIRVYNTVESGNIARLDILDSFADFPGVFPAAHQFLNITFTGRAAGENPYRLVGNQRFIIYHEVYRFFPPHTGVYTAADNEGVVFGRISGMVS